MCIVLYIHNYVVHICAQTCTCVWCSFSRVAERYSWKLDRTENFSRMRMKLIRSYPYNPHTEASIMRDDGTLGEPTVVNTFVGISCRKYRTWGKDDIFDPSHSSRVQRLVHTVRWYAYWSYVQYHLMSWLCWGWNSPVFVHDCCIIALPVYLFHTYIL